MVTLVTIIHVIVCLFMIGVVLIQSGKGASIGASFGGSSQTVFGASGPTNFLTKLTVASAVIFMLTSIFLAYEKGSIRSKGSVFEQDAGLPPIQQQIPQTTPNADQAPKAQQPADNQK